MLHSLDTNWSILVVVAALTSGASLYIYLYMSEDESMGATKVSVAEARQNFARLIKRAQQGRPIEITRRGEPVAVLLSAAEYLMLKGERPSFVEAIDRVRERLGVDALEIGDEEFAGLRDESPGRGVVL